MSRHGNVNEQVNLQPGEGQNEVRDETKTENNVKQEKSSNMKEQYDINTPMNLAEEATSIVGSSDNEVIYKSPEVIYKSPEDIYKSTPTNKINAEIVNNSENPIINRTSQDSVNSSSGKDYWTLQVVNPEEEETIDWIPEELSEGQVHEINPEEHVELEPNTRFLDMHQVNILQTCLLSDYEINSAHYVNIHVPPCYIIKKLHDSIVKNMPEVSISSMRIMGGFSSYVMCSKFRYNDLDILFNLDFPFESRISTFEKLRNLLIEILLELVSVIKPELRERLNMQELSQEYIQKSIVVPLPHEKDVNKDADCWSLVCLRNVQGRNLEFKFVKSMTRHFEFSTDSFQIILEKEYINYLNTHSKLIEPLAEYERKKALKNPDPAEDHIDLDYLKITPDNSLTYHRLPWEIPSVKVVCLYESIEKALHHLTSFKIEIYNPEGIRGGGLLKYCYLRCIGFHDAQEDEETRNKSICQMICRFLITCHDPEAQYSAISKYLLTHFPTHYSDRIEYLSTIKSVVQGCAITNVQPVKSLLDVCQRLLEYMKQELKRYHTNQGYAQQHPMYAQRPPTHQAYLYRHNDIRVHHHPRTFVLQGPSYAYTNQPMPHPQSSFAYQPGGVQHYNSQSQLMPQPNRVSPYSTPTTFNGHPQMRQQNPNNIVQNTTNMRHSSPPRKRDEGYSTHSQGWPAARSPARSHNRFMPQRHRSRPHLQAKPAQPDMSIPHDPNHRRPHRNERYPYSQAHNKMHWRH